MQPTESRQIPPPKRKRKRIRISVWGILGLVLLCIGAAVWWVLPRLSRVYITDRGIRQRCYTMQSTVKDLLGERGISLGTSDELTPAEETLLTEDTEVIIRRSVPVYIDYDGETSLVFMTKGTVRDAMALASLPFEDTDSLQPAPDTPIQSGLRITWIQLRSEDTYSESRAETEIIVRADNTLPYGEVHVSAEGTAALDIVQIRTYFRDGVLLERVIIQIFSRQTAVPRILSVGTLVTPGPTPEVSPAPTTMPSLQPSASPAPIPTKKPAVKPSTAKPTAKATTKPTITVAQTPEATATASTPVPTATRITGGSGEPPSYISTMEVSQITAYTHTGNKTATGVWPVATRTYANPGTVAVDKRVIPYGTLMYIPGYGYGLAEDAGPTGTHIDVFMDTEAECLIWGRKRNRIIYIVETGYTR